MPSSSTPYFDVEQDAAGSLRALAHPSTQGPWVTGLQHGGPPNALAVACAEHALAGTGAAGLVPVRIASDFVGPVPVAELEIRTRPLRVARSAALVEVVIAAAGRDCLSSRVWFVRDTDTASLVGELGPACAVPTGGPGMDVEFGYGASIDWRFVSGSMREAGPAAAWARPFGELFEGYSWSGLARAALVADSGNGLSAELDWEQWGFLNVDLDVHLARPPVGEWVLLDAQTQLNAHGSGLATSVLSDVRGRIGTGNQSLVVARRPPVGT